MILTGKAKEDFEKWIYKDVDWTISYINGYYSLFLKYELIIQKAKIIEWFDYIGIYPYVEYFNGVWYSYIGIFNSTGQYDKGSFKNDFTTRLEATTEAIKQANIIYNENREK